MVEPLAEWPRTVLPGLDLVPPNTVVPLRDQHRFVQAYMVGLNTEMGRELLWRGFPATCSATYFDRFWDNASAPGARARHRPDRRLGRARRSATAQRDENFVMLVRSELLRRYPDAIVYATAEAPTRATRTHPIFTGGFAPDVRFFGFDIAAAEIGDWSIVIQEHPSAPRFGVEVGTDTGGARMSPPAETNAALRRREGAPAAGADHDPRHRPAGAELMPVRVADLGPILAGRGGRPAEARRSSCGPSDLPLALFPVRLETRFFGERAARARLSRQGAHRLPRPDAERRRDALGPALLGAPVAGDDDASCGRRGGCWPTASARSARRGSRVP